MRVIIVPTDFSENAFNALRCALEYFKYEKSRFIILHTYADEVYENKAVVSRDILNAYKEIKRQESEKELEIIRKRVLKLAPNPNQSFETQAIFGSLLDEINQLVNTENADLVVMGTQGKTADRKLTYGSNTLQILRYVKCPVLGIPLNYTYERPTQLLFPSDFMMPFIGRELKLISCMAKSYRSQIHLLYISNYDRLSLRQEDIKAAWEYRFRENAIKYTRHNEEDHATVFNTYISQNKINMLILINSKHTYMETLLDSATIDKVGLNTKIPFLVLQNLPR